MRRGLEGLGGTDGREGHSRLPDGQSDMVPYTGDYLCRKEVRHGAAQRLRDGLVIDHQAQVLGQTFVREYVASADGRNHNRLMSVRSDARSVLGIHAPPSSIATALMGNPSLA